MGTSSALLPCWLALGVVLATATSCATTSATSGPGRPDALSPAGDPVLDVDGHRVVVDIFPTTVSDDATLAWVRRAASMVSDYFGEFSVDELEVEVITLGWSGVSFGIHYEGEKIRVLRGLWTSAEEMERDWVLVHEMIHTAFPMVAKKHRWMREGLSTYLESIVRAEAGVLDEKEVWQRFVRQMPTGLPKGSNGLDAASGWSNLYWGGALFWMIADVRIREATDGKRSLKDALRAIMADGGTARTTWKVDRILKTGDEATQTTVLRDLYGEMALRPIAIDLDAFFAKLGVRRVGSNVTLDDEAPLAAIRKQMTAKTHELPAIPR